MELVFTRQDHYWECETCGGIYDASLTVALDGRVIGEFAEDGHFGSTQIVAEEVEACVTTALGLTDTELNPLRERRAQLQAELAALYQVPTTWTPEVRAQQEQAYWRQVDAKEVELGDVFRAFLVTRGVAVREEEPPTENDDDERDWDDVDHDEAEDEALE